jgi:hypothetical protein
VRVAGFVDKRLNKAKADINAGQAEIKAYVASLPKDLQSVGQEAEKAMESRFNEMRDGVESKKNELATKLAEKYKAAHDQANELAKKIEEENAGAFKKLADAVGEVIKIIMEFKDKLMALLRKAADAIELILDDPIGFLGNLIAAVKLGVNQFVGNIWTHLKAGFMKWLFGALADAGIEIPTDLSLVSIFKLVLSVLGITYPRMRAKAVKLIGETAVTVIEQLVKYIAVLIEGGPAKLWEQVKSDIGDLKAMVIDAIQSWLIDTVIKQAAIKLLSFFNPAGAFVQAVIAIYNTVVFIIENASKIMAFVEAVINSVSSIAQGAIGAAASWIEQSLARIIPLVIGFLARLIGLGGISKKIKEFITKVQTKVDQAIDKAIAKVVQTVKKLFGKLTGKGKDKDKDKKDDPDKQKKVDAGLADIEKEEKRFKESGKIEKEDAQKVASTVKGRHPVFKSIKVVDGGATWDYDYVASPGVVKKGATKIGQDVMSKNNRKKANEELNKIKSSSQVSPVMVELEQDEAGILGRYKGTADGYQAYLKDKKNGDTFEWPLTYLRNRAARKKGKAIEAQWIKKVIGAGKNNQAFEVKQGRVWNTVIPDILTNSVVGDAKDWKDISFTEQLRAFHMIAKAGRNPGKVKRNGVEVKWMRSFVLIVRSKSHSEGKTNVSGPLKGACDTIYYRITDKDVKT